MRNVFYRTLIELARRDERVFFVGSDLGAGTLDAFRSEFPDRFLMEGVSEANILGLCAGLAMNGKIPYFNTIDTFITRRGLEQVILDLALHDLPVRLVASGGGGVYAPLGPTHWALEDVALLRPIPNLTILVPADVAEMERCMRATLDARGPIFLRLGKGGEEPVVTPPCDRFEIGKGVPVIEGRHALIVTTGVVLARALEASRALAGEGIEAGVLHLSTVKPLDVEAIVERARQVRAVATVEEHFVTGGLGSAVAETLLEAGLARPPAFARIGFPDRFPTGYGSQATLMDEAGITAGNIARTVARLVGRTATFENRESKAEHRRGLATLAPTAAFENRRPKIESH